MDFQGFGITVINAVMVMSLVVLLREKVARNKRKDADDQELILDLTKWDKTRIPLFKRKSRNTSIVALTIIGAVLVWIVMKNPQAMIETLIMALAAGGLVVYMRKKDEKKEVGVYTKGILHKTGFVYFNNISGYKTSESDDYKNAFDVWIMIGNTPKIQVYVPKEEIKTFEKLIRKHAQIKK